MRGSSWRRRAACRCACLQGTNISKSAAAAAAAATPAAVVGVAAAGAGCGRSAASVIPTAERCASSVVARASRGCRRARMHSFLCQCLPAWQPPFTGLQPTLVCLPARPPHCPARRSPTPCHLPPPPLLAHPRCVRWKGVERWPADPVLAGAARLVQAAGGDVRLPACFVSAASGPCLPKGLLSFLPKPQPTLQVRYVLLKGYDERGFVWYTNYDSSKARANNNWKGRHSSLDMRGRSVAGEERCWPAASGSPLDPRPSLPPSCCSLRGTLQATLS